MSSACGRAAALLLLLLFTHGAKAHPHMWVTLKSEVIFASDGLIVAVRYAWSFDEMTSAFAMLSAKPRRDGAFTGADLEPLAQASLSSLRENDYFTSATANGINQPLGPAGDYWLQFEEGVLTLHFTLPFKSPVRAHTLELIIYDPSYFVDISFPEKAPVTLLNAPSGCELLVARQSWARVANKLVVSCPSISPPGHANAYERGP